MPCFRDIVNRLMHIFRITIYDFHTSCDFCKNIVQIPFNAWHYMDANLWASLVTHIFDKLAEHLAGNKKEKFEQKKEEIYKKIDSTKAFAKQIEKKVNKIDFIGIYSMVIGRGGLQAQIQ